MYVPRGSSKVRGVRLILPALLLVVLAAPLAAASGGGWVATGYIGPGTLYDYDEDGVAEPVGVYGVVEGVSVIASPYPTLNATLSDVDGDGVAELVLYGGGSAYVYDGMRLEGNYTVPDAAPVVAKRAIAFANTILWRGSLYTVGGVDYVVPAATQTSLYAVYTRNGALRALNVLTGAEYVVYPDDFRPLYAVHRYNKILIAAATPSNNLAVLEWPIGGAPQVSVYSVEPEAVAGYNAVYEEFYVKADDHLYKATVNGLLLVSEWEPVYWERDYIYLYSGDGELAVYSTLLREPVAVVKLPRTDWPEAAFGYPSLVVTYDNESYIYYAGPIPYAVVRVPPYTIAGEPVNITVVTDYNYTILIDGAPGNTTWVFTEPGLHTVKVVVTNGVITREYTYNVTVRPRPIQYSIQVLDPPEPLGSMTILVSTGDGLTGETVDLPASITLNGDSYNFTTNAPVEVPVGWPDTPRLTVTLVVGGGPYETVERTISVPVAPVTAEPVIHYLGGGVVLIEFTVLGEPVNGSVDVAIDGNIIYSGATPAEFRLPAPGNYTLRVHFVPDTLLARSAVYEINVSYAGNVTEAPELSGWQVLVADRIINNTVVVYENQTVTVTETVTKPVEKPVTDTGLVIFAGVAGGGIGLSLGLVIGSETIRRAIREHLKRPARRQEEPGQEPRQTGDDLFEEA